MPACEVTGKVGNEEASEKIGDREWGGWQTRRARVFGDSILFWVGKSYVPKLAPSVRP
jgi:hypothetical protein